MRHNGWHVGSLLKVGKTFKGVCFDVWWHRDKFPTNWDPIFVLDLETRQCGKFWFQDAWRWSGWQKTEEGVLQISGVRNHPCDFEFMNGFKTNDSRFWVLWKDGIDEPPDKAEIEAIAEKSIAWWAILQLSGVLG